MHLFKEKEKNMHKFWKFIADPTHMKNVMCIYKKIFIVYKSFENTTMLYYLRYTHCFNLMCSYESRTKTPGPLLNLHRYPLIISLQDNKKCVVARLESPEKALLIKKTVKCLKAEREQKKSKF